MDVSQYLEIFIDETKEHLQTLSDQLMILETEPDNMETINEIFRAAHSLKGMAGTMGYKRMQRLTHDMENVFQEIRSGNMKVQPELIDCSVDWTHWKAIWLIFWNQPMRVRRIMKKLSTP